MTVWRAAEAVAIGVAVLMAGTVAWVGSVWLLSHIGRRWGTDDTPMGTTKPTQAIQSPAEANAIRAKADARRARADERRNEAGQIESGQPVRTIKLVGRGGR